MPQLGNYSYLVVVVMLRVQVFVAFHFHIIHLSVIEPFCPIVVSDQVFLMQRLELL